jgi:hypothetical protein
VDVEQRSAAFEPVFIVFPQGRGAGGITEVEALREDAQEHRQREERAGGLNEGKPFGVVAGGGHGVNAEKLKC